MSVMNKNELQHDLHINHYRDFQNEFWKDQRVPVQWILISKYPHIFEIEYDNVRHLITFTNWASIPSAFFICGRLRWLSHSIFPPLRCQNNDVKTKMNLLVHSQMFLLSQKGQWMVECAIYPCPLLLYYGFVPCRESMWPFLIFDLLGLAPICIQRGNNVFCKLLYFPCRQLSF